MFFCDSCLLCKALYMVFVLWWVLYKKTSPAFDRPSGRQLIAVVVDLIVSHTKSITSDTSGMSQFTLAPSDSCLTKAKTELV